ncbi:hypothetical protein NE237_031473 [Protea cynaroides]|uniref:Nudix hydrolase domain-containing protein n=1 Tax=Protea cynaroides TaxID=273540 RepID=A0A9Q0L1M8_9MAGN|nr:hypothetical protein NE237_031473 [Protea cynaroides]
MELLKGEKFRNGPASIWPNACIPYRYKNEEHPSCENFNTIDDEDELEILVITSQKSHSMLFPKGGWETDESIEEAALQETVEEAGVKGKVQRVLYYLYFCFVEDSNKDSELILDFHARVTTTVRMKTKGSRNARMRIAW